MPWQDNLSTKFSEFDSSSVNIFDTFVLAPTGVYFFLKKPNSQGKLCPLYTSSIDDYALSKYRIYGSSSYPDIRTFTPPLSPIEFRRVKDALFPNYSIMVDLQKRDNPNTFLYLDWLLANGDHGIMQVGESGFSRVLLHKWALENVEVPNIFTANSKLQIKSFRDFRYMFDEETDSFRIRPDNVSTIIYTIVTSEEITGSGSPFYRITVKDFSNTSNITPRNYNNNRANGLSIVSVHPQVAGYGS